ncbi:MAG: C-terminal target protein [Flavipsychrobacter sp.]|jgi:hypothetical protein|nr:C-terminal target protein [Flavipsychrobacter sp.]
MKRFYFSKLIIPVILVMGFCSSTFAQPTSYTTPGAYIFTVPAGCSGISVDVAGAKGGNYSSTGYGGKGGRVIGNYAVTPGQLLYVYVGAKGVDLNGGAGGSSFGGGHNGGNGGASGGGSGGGAASSIRTSITGGATSTASLGSRIFVGAGGGGGNYSCSPQFPGGVGGHPSGANGQSNCSSPPAYGATQTAGGAGNCYSGCGAAGTFGNGGNGTYWGGGGGGGWYGGGGGSESSGGGGSNYASTSATNVTHTTGYQDADGYVIITPLLPAITPSPSSLSFGAVTVGTRSAPALYTELTGVYLSSADVTPNIIGPSTNRDRFYISVDGVNWYNGSELEALALASTPYSITHAGTTLNPYTRIYVKFAPAATSAVTATLQLTGAGLATPVNISLSGTGSSGCTGTPPGGTVTVTPSAASVITPITMSLTGSAGAAGYTYQWQRASALAGPYTNIPGAVLRSYTQQGIPANSWFRVITTCPNTPASATSNTVAVTMAGVAPSTCTPTSGGCGFVNWFLVGNPSFPFRVYGASTLQDSYNPVCNIFYTDNSASTNALLTTTLGIGATYNTTVGYSNGNINSTQIWIDFNNSGDFSPEETVGGRDQWNGGTATPQIIIPSTATPGIYRLRVIVTFGAGNNSSQPRYPNIPPCPTTGVQYAETRDYRVTIVYPPCSGIPYAGITDASATSACAAFTPNLFNVGPQLGVGLSYIWQQSTDGLGYSDITGATTAVYSPTVTATGLTYYRTRVTCANGGGVGYTNGLPIAKYDPPATPTSSLASFAFCTNTTLDAINATSGGVWSTSNSLVATVGSISGTVYGTGVGNATLSYTIPSTGCYSTAELTVNQLPSQIYPSNIVLCQGQSIALSDTIPGGDWISTVPLCATINSSGVLTGGLCDVTIQYRLPTGCMVSTNVTVNPLPTQRIVSGGGTYCTGSSSSSPTNNPVMLDGSQLGVRYDLIMGGSVITTLMGTGSPLNFGVQTAPGTYTVFATNLATGCSRGMALSATVAINPPPTVFPLTGGGSFCAGDLDGQTVTVSNSEVNVNYYLYQNGINTGVYINGAGGPITFTNITDPGIYTVEGVHAVTNCTVFMSGSVIITIDPLPTAYNVTGGGNYCAGGSGRTVSLDRSTVGINYALYRYDPPVNYYVSTLAGTGGSLNFGSQTATGTYTIVATNASTGCVNNMTGFAVIGIDMPPIVHNVSGTGSYCAGGTGRTVILDIADIGVDYQLYLGTATTGVPLSGAGSQLDFANQTAPGVYTVRGTDVITGCTTTMAGSATISIDLLPNVYNMGGGGPYCAGGTGRDVTMGPASQTGISYQLYLNSNAAGMPVLMGTGAPLNFGPQTGQGVYTVIATNPATGCTKQMSGVSTIGVNPLPTLFDVTGSGAYCAGGAGINVGLSFSSTGISYQLYRNGVLLGSAVSGSGAALNFGAQTVAGTYTVRATNTITGCSTWMNGSAIISINPLPPVHAVTGGGNYCAGGAGMPVNLNGSNTGITYQLMLGLTAIGAPMPGTGSALNFGLQTLPGTYTIVATDNTNGCTKYMFGGAPVIANPLPTVFTMTGGGAYCTGGPGVLVGLSGSALGIKYQLMIDGVPSGTPMSGTGSAINFGFQVTPGTYTVVAKNNTTLCTNSMAGNVVVAIQAAPVAFSVTGGGSYCMGGSGIDVILTGSDPGIDYQLYRGTTMVGAALPGDGSALNFGPQTAAGTYTVKATEVSTGCNANMNSSANILINPLPTSFTVLGGGSYCTGASGVHVFLSASTLGIQYQLYNGSTLMGTMTGTGSSIDFGLQTTVGSYTVVADNLVTTCSNNMAGSASVSINPLPDAHNVIGGGSYCTGGTGVHVGLDGSDAGIKYQLFNGTSMVGTSMSGTGSAIDFGAMTGAGSYTVLATNISTMCANDQTGSASISINPLPAAYSVTGGGSYCETGLGVHVGIGNSATGVNYQLYHNTSPVGIALPGTGTALDLGLHNMVGLYTVSATDAATGCQAGMTGSTTISVLPILIPHVNVTPSIAGTVCVGQVVSFSASPVNGGATPTYQWRINGVSAGVGSTYSYIPLDGDVVTAMITSTAQCAHPDTGSTSIFMTVSPMQMPSASVAADPGSLVCSGAPVTLTATTMYGGTAPSLVWLKNGLEVGTGSSYSYYPSNGDIITFKLESNFNCRLSDVVFGNPVTFTVENPVLPIVTVTSSANHENLTAGQPVTFTATAVNAGARPTYQWLINSTVIPGATNSTFTTSNLAHRDSVTCEVMGVCALVGFNSVKVEVSRTGVNQVTSANNVRLIPNPNKGEFRVTGTLATVADEEVTLEVVNMLGQVIYTGKVATQNGVINEQVKLNSSLANGMYLLNLRSGSDNTVFHFVIEQ